MRDLSDLVLRRSDFEPLSTLCVSDLQFPRSYAGWLSMIEAATTQAHGLGLFPPPLLLDVNEFEAWCKRVEIVPGIDALRAFCIVNRGRVVPLEN